VCFQRQADGEFLWLRKHVGRRSDKRKKRPNGQTGPRFRELPLAKLARPAIFVSRESFYSPFSAGPQTFNLCHLDRSEGSASVASTGTRRTVRSKSIGLLSNRAHR
jgi:hypothetical protein